MFVCGAEEQILHDLLCQGLFSAAFFRDNKLSVERRSEPVARGGTMWPWVIGAIAVGNLRNASAVFFFQAGHWHTVGRAVFNMNPDEALVHFKNQYERVGP